MKDKENSSYFDKTRSGGEIGSEVGDNQRGRGELALLMKEEERKERKVNSLDRKGHFGKTQYKW